MDLLRRWMVRHFGFPLHQRLTHRDVAGALARLEKSQWWPPERLKEWKEKEIRRLLLHASRHVPYYRDLFTSLNLDPEKAAGVDWDRIPLLSKKTVREEFDRLQATDRKRLSITGQTSGSTGNPVTWRVDRWAESVQWAVHLRGRSWWKLRLGDPHVMLWGRDASQGRRKELRDLWVWNKRVLPVIQLSEENVEPAYRQLRKWRPSYLRGYPSVLVLFGQLCQARGLPLDKLSLRGVVTTAETLRPDQRARIRAAYGCPVINEYGCTEVQCIAFECPEGSMHIQSDAVRVEFMRDGRPVRAGEIGEIVVTDLANETMPVIRYQTGDLGRPKEGQCPCGRMLPRMELAIGRAAEIITLPDGRTFHSEVFTPSHDSILFSLVHQFRVLHEAPARFRVQVVVPQESFVTVEREFIQWIRQQLGDGLEVVVERVETIPRTSSGKQPYFISCLPERHD